MQQWCNGAFWQTGEYFSSPAAHCRDVSESMSHGRSLQDKLHYEVSGTLQPMYKVTVPMLTCNVWSGCSSPGYRPY